MSYDIAFMAKLGLPHQRIPKSRCGSPAVFPGFTIPLQQTKIPSFGNSPRVYIKYIPMVVWERPKTGHENKSGFPDRTHAPCQEK